MVGISRIASPNMYALDDTIAAIATPIGEGGIGIVRLSGPQSASILRRVFSPGREARAGRDARLESRRLTYGHVVVPENGETVDEVLAVFMAAPRTYTREDVAEIHCHGGVVPLRRTLELVLRSGARLARPGEFTLRAFLNGRTDLAQAEAVLDVVRARTEASARIAVGQLEGRMSEPIRQARSALLHCLASLEATLDFPDEDVNASSQGATGSLNLPDALHQTAQLLGDLLSQADQGLVYRQGVRAVIVGRPNVGKSSLLNALLRYDRAIVTPLPGTTRDTVEETLDLSGVPFCLVDTAGIAESHNPLDQLGIERSRSALINADLVLFVVDGSEPLTAEDRALDEELRNRSVLVVVNKADLLQLADCANIVPDAVHVSVSALTGSGLTDLEQAMTDAVLAGQVLVSDRAVVSNPRHKEALSRALARLSAAIEGLSSGVPVDLLASDLRQAAGALGEITGESVDEDLLSTIFGDFCIGK
ncbi:MAG TPA: tRNA uridine-5-carboxymethylaminomethyl(34) synthesis GTPase MnmE [Anaerolineae bacterium]|nr:tRNA uridine-5-carboxymethylaminomethyl(34) synthesis GTPase MnmE [Anaerolineae bacterium]